MLRLSLASSRSSSSSHTFTLVTLIAVTFLLCFSPTFTFAQSPASTSTGSSGGPPAPTCVQLPPTSVCAQFYPQNAWVDVTPTFSCLEDAEASLKSGPVVWNAIKLLQGPTSTCSQDFAQLMCFVTIRPCAATVSRSFCQQTLGNNGTAGTCSAQLQGGLMSLMIPRFSQIFNCQQNPVFQDSGVGPFVDAATMMVPTPQCQPLSATSVCRGVVDYDVYVPWNYYGDQSQIEKNVQLSFRAAMATASLATGCLLSLSKMMCSLVYTRCDTTVLATSLAAPLAGSPSAAALLPYLTVPFPRLPCQTLCTDVNLKCGLLLASNPTLNKLANCTGQSTVLKPTPTCNGAYQGDQGDNFPTSTSTLASVTIGGSAVPLQSQCNDFVNSYPTNETAVITCPAPLVRVTSLNDPNAILGGSCATPCPTLLFTREEWASTDRFMTGLTITSFLASLFLWLTWLIFPVKRKQVNTLCFNTCTVTLSFAVLIVLMKTDGHPSQISCKNADTYNVQGDGGACLFQGMVFFYFTLAGVIFWCVSAADLFIKIVLNKKIDMLKQRKLNLFYMISGWSLPFLLLIIALGIKAFGGGTGTPWCFFNPGNPSFVDWLLFYYPILVLVLFGSFCMFSIIYKMVLSAKATGSNRRPGWWKTQVRPFLFVFIFIFLFTFIFGYRAHSFFKEDSYKTSATAWVQCIISTMGDFSVCGTKPADHPNIGLFYMIQLAVAGQGLLNSVIFGSQWMNFTLWYGLLTGKGTNHAGTQEGTQDSRTSRGADKTPTNSRPNTRQNSGRNVLELGKEENGPAPAVAPQTHVSLQNAAAANPEMVQSVSVLSTNGHDAESDPVVSATAVASDASRI